MSVGDYVKKSTKINVRKTKKCRELKPQPGDYANLKGWIDKNRKYTCSDMERKIYADNLEDLSMSNTKDKKRGKRYC